MSMRITHPGILSLLQDNGRLGQHRLGLSSGGPLDSEAFYLCNRLLQNPNGSTAIEISAGGLQLLCTADTWICLTGASMPLSVNGKEHDNWTVHRVREGDAITVGFSRAGVRAYLGVAGGFSIAPSFGSTATVVREGIGGLQGKALNTGDSLPHPVLKACKSLFLPARERPRYLNSLTVRVIPGYQQRIFSRIAKRRFFGAPYTVSERCDRMGYRMQGPAINCAIGGILSEGICPGAIQVPPDGQPIILLNDRQTIGGYPKLGAALSTDVARLTQLTAGAKVHFAPITTHTARRALRLSALRLLKLPLEERRD